MTQDTALLLLVLIICATLISILYAFLILRRIKKIKVQHEEIKAISSYIKEGTLAFLKREYRIIVIFVVAIAIVLGLLELIPVLSGAEGIGINAAICFLVGASLSGFAGYLGMRSGIMSNAVTAEAANDHGMGKALKMAFTGGSVLGLSVVGFGLFGLVLMFTIFYAITGEI
ncbi:MAG: sodium/proton-translocating pyrophosphatase, partial [Candidatus Izemoplasmatales bacterium]